MTKTKPRNEPYIIRGKGIEAWIYTSPTRTRFWLLPGEMVVKNEARGLKRYRPKAWRLRRGALNGGFLVDVGSHFLLTQTLVFDCVSDAASFVLGGSRSGDRATSGKKKLTGDNITKYRESFRWGGLDG